MFCMQCGAKLIEGAKFCHQCGAKVPENLVTAPAPTQQEGEASTPAQQAAETPAPAQPAAEAPTPAQSTAEAPAAVQPEPAQPLKLSSKERSVTPADSSVPDLPGATYSILSRYEVHFSPGVAARRKIWRTFNTEGTKLGYKMYWKVKNELELENYSDPLELRKNLISAVFVACAPLFNDAVDLLLEYGVDHVSAENLMDDMLEKCQESELFETLGDDAEAIDAYLQQLGEEKAVNRAGWRGGGFGLTGAIKGAVEAEVLNAAQNGLSSLGRVLTGNTYSGRAKRFIADRLNSHDYPELVSSLTRSICRGWLIDDVTSILNRENKLPDVSFRTAEANSRADNIPNLLLRGKYTEEQAMQGLCQSLEVTLNPIRVYKAMVEIAPEAIPDVLKIADGEGEALELARGLWNETHYKGSLPFPKWMAKYDVHSGTYVRNTQELALLSYMIRDFRECYDTTSILLADGEEYTIYPELEGLSYYGFGDDVSILVPSDKLIDFPARDVHFHHVHFTGSYADLVAEAVDKRYEEAMTALYEGRREDAVPLLKACAEMGDLESAYKLGMLYHALHDDEKAVLWLEEAADSGYVEAAWELSHLLSATDDEKSFAYLKQAADAGHGDAAFTLGMFYENGVGLKDGPDYFKAEPYYQVAVKEDVMGAAEALARNREKMHTPQFREKQFDLYLHYVSNEKEKAFRYLRNAASLGGESAQRILVSEDLQAARELLSSEDEEQWEKAVSVLGEAVSYRSPEAMYRLAELKEAGKGTEEDAKGAEALYAEAARGGYGPACLRAGRKEEEQKHYTEAFSWYQQSAEAKIPEAQARLGYFFETGLGTAKNAAKAIFYYREALQGGIQEVLPSLLPLDLSWGEHCAAEKNYGEALACFEEAGKNGETEAMLKAAELRGSREYPEGFDYARAMDWYHAAADSMNGSESPETREKRACLKASVSYAVRLAYFSERFGKLAEEDGHYYVGAEAVSKRLENAMKGYGSALHVPAEEVVLLCDSSNSIFWGKGKKGFMITSSGVLFTSGMDVIPLDQVQSICYTEDRTLQTDGGIVLSQLAKSDNDVDEPYFCRAMNADVLFSSEERQIAEKHGIHGVPANPQQEAAPASSGEPEPSPQEPISEQEEPVSSSIPSETRQEPRPEPQPEPQPSASAAAGPGMGQLLSFVKELDAVLGDSPTYLYCAPHIPKKKLANVLSGYAKNLGIVPEDVLLLCDNTVFGSAKDGFILTEMGLVSSESGVLPLSEIQHIEPSHSIWGGEMTAEPGHKVIATIPPDKELTHFCDGLNKIL
ncbi:MAG: hypothetical protein ACFWT7_02300 [Succiniclasticum sp.]